MMEVTHGIFIKRPIINIIIIRVNKLSSRLDSITVTLFIFYWHERSALQSVAVRRSTGNDVSGPLFARAGGVPVSRRSGGRLATTSVATIFIIIFPPRFLFSVVTFSHRRSARIKKLI